MISWWTSALDHRSIWKTILDKDHLRFCAIGAAVVRFIHASRHGKIVSKKRHERGVLHSQSSSLQLKDVQIGWDKEMMCFMNFSMSSHQDKSRIFHTLLLHHFSTTPSSHFDKFDAWLRKLFTQHLAGWIEAVKSARQRLDVSVSTLEIQRARSGFSCFPLTNIWHFSQKPSVFVCCSPFTSMCFTWRSKLSVLGFRPIGGRTKPVCGSDLTWFYLPEDLKEI